MIRIKNWGKFQHFKDRKPPWIKLYRDILDDMAWHQLDTDAAKTLVMLWLLASEAKGELPPLSEIAFRLRLSETQVKTTISKLSHWLVQDDINPISEQHQDDSEAIALARSRETETETETETECKGGSADPPTVDKSKNYSEEFEGAWRDYPKRAGKNDKRLAFRAWRATKKRCTETSRARTVQSMTKGVRRYADHIKGTGKLGTEFVMQASTFFGPADPPNWSLDWELPKKSNGELKKSLRGMKGDELLALAAKYNVGTYGLSTEKLIPLIQRAMDAADNAAPTIDTRLR